MAKKPTHNWKTKQKDGIRYMICQNSDLEKSRHPKWAAGGKTCQNWTAVGENTDAVLCSDCTAESVRF